jgi:hypothetical protein
MSQSHHMFYAFIDERFEDCTTHSRFIVACSFFNKNRWEAQYQNAVSIDKASPKQRIQTIAQVLQNSGGFAVLTYADVPAALAQAGEIDGTEDILSMKRRDNLWSQIVLLAVDTAVACLHGAPLPKLEIAVFYDPKSLKLEHRLAFKKMLHDDLPQIAKAATEVLGNTAPVYIRCVEEVPKRKSGEQANVFQEGIHVSHHLCAQSKNLIEGGSGTGIIIVRNYTDEIIRMISKFL